MGTVSPGNPEPEETDRSGLRIHLHLGDMRSELVDRVMGASEVMVGARFLMNLSVAYSRGDFGSSITAYYVGDFIQDAGQLLVWHGGGGPTKPDSRPGP